MLRIGVLCLVDQDVVDAAVELVQHPAGADAAEQIQGLMDQVVEIEGAEPGLLQLDAAVDLGGELEQGLRAGMGPGGPQPIEDRLQPVALRDQGLLHGGRHTLGAEAAIGLRLVLLREEDPAVEGQRLGSVRKLLGADPLGLRRQRGLGELLVVGLAGAQAGHEPARSSGRTRGRPPGSPPRSARRSPRRRGPAPRGGARKRPRGRPCRR